MNRKAVLMASIFLVLALGLTATPAQAVEMQKAIVWGKVEKAMLFPKTPPSSLPAKGRIYLYAKEPATAKVYILLYIPDIKAWTKVKLVSVESVDIEPGSMDILGYWDVYVNGEPLQEGLKGRFESNWNTWNLKIPWPWVPSPKATAIDGSVTWYRCW